MNKSEKRQNRISDPAQRVQEYYDNILSSLIDGIVVVDNEFRITTFSATAEQMTEIKADSVQGKKLSEIFDEKSGIHTLVMKTIQTGRSYSDSNFSIYGYFGDRHDIGLATSPLIDFQGMSIGVVIVFRDLSQVKSLEERLRKGERLASLGILAAGMAHEIKNPLGGIRGASQLLSKEMGEGHLLQEYTDVIIREADRLNMIIQ
ncbi:MAG: PAS domain S-box protein [bacterium]